MGCSCSCCPKLIQIHKPINRPNPKNLLHTKEITCFSVKQNGEFIATGSLDGVGIVWGFNHEKEASFGKPLMHLIGHTRGITCIKYSKDELKVATSSLDKRIILWNVDVTDVEKYGLPIILLKNKVIDCGIMSLDFSPDDRRIASGGRDKKATIWNVYMPKKKKKKNITIKNVEDGKNYEFELDLEVEVKDEEDLTRIFNERDRYEEEQKKQEVNTDFGCIVTSLINHTSSVSCVKYSHDGKILATGSDDKSIILWFVNEGEEGYGTIITKLYGHKHFINSVCFTEGDRKLISVSSDESAKIWLLENMSGKKIKTLKKHVSYRKNENTTKVFKIKNMSSLATTGGLLVTGGYDNAIYLWDIKEDRRLKKDWKTKTYGKEIKRIDCLNDIVNYVEIVKEKEILVAGGRDQNLYLININQSKGSKKSKKKTEATTAELGSIVAEMKVIDYNTKHLATEQDIEDVDIFFEANEQLEHQENEGDEEVYEYEDDEEYENENEDEDNHDKEEEKIQDTIFSNEDNRSQNNEQQIDHNTNTVKNTSNLQTTAA